MLKRAFSPRWGTFRRGGSGKSCACAILNIHDKFHFRLLVIATAVGLFPAFNGVIRADGPADNHPETVRRIPKLGVEVPTEIAAELRESLDSLRSKIESLRTSDLPAARKYVPDVSIFHRAVHDALTCQEFFHKREFEVARRLLRQGHLRADQLQNGEMPWARQTGLVVRGFVSKIDGSVQPYGLVIPESYLFDSSRPIAADLWFHGRGETLSEVNFLNQRQANAGVFKPESAIMIHPYGRYSNANKFAGEVDALEALAAAQREYAIDSDRVSVRGFSMGGASTWQLAVHYPGRWAAANPGAGFSETPDFLQTFQQETLTPFWWEKKLWRWYDAIDWAGNLRHCPTVAYSGELDRQKQAADIMALALRRHDLGLVHLIGPKTQHRYQPEVARDVESRLRDFSQAGRERVPRQIEFTTYTLRYPSMRWVTIDGLEEHWEPGVFKAQLLQDSIVIDPQGITGFTLDFKPGEFPFRVLPTIKIISDENLTARVQTFDSSDFQDAPLMTDRSWSVSFERVAERWQPVSNRRKNAAQLKKRPGLQGPIDDALMGSFLFVRPTGTSEFISVADWADSEMNRAIEHWRRHFRGHARVKDDVDVTEEDVANHHLILWGTPDSNRVWETIADKLPIQLSEGQWKVGDRSFTAKSHVPVMIYPNPLNARRYVVTNSSFTFRDYAYLNNARQVPMLPDWAMVDLSVPPGNVWPGRIVLADFFDESWEVKLPIREPVKVKPPAPIVFANSDQEGP